MPLGKTRRVSINVLIEFIWKHSPGNFMFMHVRPRFVEVWVTSIHTKLLGFLLLSRDQQMASNSYYLLFKLLLHLELAVYRTRLKLCACWGPLQQGATDFPWPSHGSRWLPVWHVWCKMSTESDGVTRKASRANLRFPRNSCFVTTRSTTFAPSLLNQIEYW